MGESDFDRLKVIWRNHIDSLENIESRDEENCGLNWGQFLSLFCTALIIIKTSKNI